MSNREFEVIDKIAQHFGVRSHPSQFTQDIPADLDKNHLSFWLRVCQNMGLEATQFSADEAKQIDGPFLIIDANQCWVTKSLLTRPSIELFNGDGNEYLELSELVAVKARYFVGLSFPQTASNDNVTSANSSSNSNQNRQHSLSSSKHWLLTVLKEVRPWYRDLLLASFVINLLALVIPLFTMNVYDRVVPNQAIETLWVLVVAVIVVLIFEWILKESRSSITDMAGQYIDNKLSAILFQRVLGMKLESKPNSVGSFTRQIQDFDSVKEFFTSATMVTLVDLPFTVFFLMLIGWLGGPMLWIPVGVMAFVLIVSLVMKNRIAATFEHTSQLSMQKQAQLFDNITNLSDIKQYNAQRVVQGRWENTSSQLSQWQMRSRFYSNIVAHTIQSSQHIVTVGLIIVGVHLIIAGELTMGGLIATVMLSGRAASSVNQISMLLLRYQQTKAAVASVSSVMELEQEANPSQVISQGRLKGNVVLNEVSFQYPECDATAVSQLSLSIKQGEKIGLIGPSGAGKSTLLSLLARQVSPTGGQLNYENVDARLWPLPLLRQSMGWVAQSPMLLQGTVYENILLGESKVDEEKLKRALYQSGLALIIPRLEKGLETSVGELGRHVSGGQRQAIALARALYNQPSLLMLDEPTASLDQAVETHFLKMFATLDSNTTCVVSSHSRRLLELCDRIVVMDAGQIVTIGMPQDILTNSNRSRVRNVSVVQQEARL